MPAVEKAVVSKRSGRLYVEDGMDKETEAYKPKRNTGCEEPETEGWDKQSSCSTTTRHVGQSSSEPSPIVQPTSGIQEVDNLVLGGLGRRRSDSELREAFHPPLAHQHAAYSAYELEKSHLAEGRPANFGVVVPGVYRSSFPRSEDYAFIEGLKLKTIVTLVRKDFPEGYDAFLQKNGIRHCVFDMKGTKKEDIPLQTMKSILRLVLDRRNHPLLVHCNHGKHRTGCVIGVVRKLSGWDIDSIVSEYKTYAEPKARDCDVKYIMGFELSNISNLSREASWPFRTAGFLRASLFALVMVVVWFTSSSRIATARTGPASERKLLGEALPIEV
ncbi:tyrosine phosphatase family-domain-containing protein [Achaetomium macrosporum]|uniref:diphosphoinositol-polyphosphate diphosphatase n=1 Tax=Achaetomium macrosporum TaxID=79813 RepID=A0AAN7CID5_9PEZI|nr:tyrosine phosphatase family-domain-containing protein [Achaetomium macrosporum]